MTIDVLPWEGSMRVKMTCGGSSSSSSGSDTVRDRFNGEHPRWGESGWKELRSLQLHTLGLPALTCMPSIATRMTGRERTEPGSRGSELYRGWVGGA